MKRLLLILLAFVMGASMSAHATEGAVGRPITGLQVQPYAGLIPPTPGWSLAIGYAYYDGTIGASKQIPLTGGGTSFGLDGNFSLLSISALYIWNTGPGAWNFASLVTMPFAFETVSAEARIGQYNARVSQSVSGLYDMTFVPVIASHHFSQTQHMSLALYIYAPTGSYEKGQLANLSLNNWTFAPTVGYTGLFQQGSLEWSALSAIEFYTRDNATDYQNGPIFRVDSLLMKRFPTGFGAGVVGAWIQQISKDTGPTADKLNGFEGHSLGIGPMFSYTKKWQGGQAEVDFRWVHEFDVKNRLDGEPLMLTLTVSL
jgi:hypothetical protein